MGLVPLAKTSFSWRVMDIMASGACLLMEDKPDWRDLFEKYFIIIKKEDPDIFELPTVISIPSNLAFVYDYPEKAEKVLKRAKEFREKYFTRLLFSWSTDGLYCIEGRENKKLSQEYFDTIFKFCKKIGCGFHPMISASNVKYWKENYQWWLDMYKKFDLSSGTNDFQPMMLEVRNNDWTEENIKDYEDFLSFGDLYYCIPIFW